MLTSPRGTGSLQTRERENQDDAPSDLSEFRRRYRRIYACPPSLRGTRSSIHPLDRFQCNEWIWLPNIIGHVYTLIQWRYRTRGDRNLMPVYPCKYHRFSNYTSLCAEIIVYANPICIFSIEYLGINYVENHRKYHINYFQSYTSITLLFFHHIMDNFPKQLAKL